MARLINLLPIACLALAACGGESVVTGNADAIVNPPGAASVDPKVAAEMEKLKKIADELAAQKPAFDEAKAAGDVIRLEELADTGNVHAQYDRAVLRLALADEAAEGRAQAPRTAPCTCAALHRAIVFLCKRPVGLGTLRSAAQPADHREERLER